MSGNLPFLLSSFIGRSQELAALRHLVMTHRLVTLTGAGGAGKTRLSLAVAAAVADQFADGIFLVELASLAEPALVAQALATAVSFRELPQQDVLDSLIEWLYPRQVLLLLDNCEHLLVACAQTAVSLLHTCPQLKILATSREALGVMGEIVWPVPPLSLPGVGDSVEQLITCDAVQLFVERATAVSPTFTLNPSNAAALAQLCHKLDGLPLAIELAAARTRHLSIEQIATHLETSLDLLAAKDPTVPPRQQTLTAAIDWSYNALAEDEARMLRHLSVFAGGFTLTAVAAVIDDPLSVNRKPITNYQLSITDHLSQLIDKSLVVVASREPEPTYRLLEIVRQYAREKCLAMGEETAVQAQHAHYYYQLAQTAAPHIRSRHRAQWQEKLEAEYDNILAALTWFARNEAMREGGQMVWSLGWFFYFRGTVSEVNRRAHAFLALPDVPEQTAVRARLHWCIGATDWVFGNYQQAYDTLTQGRQLAETAADHTALAYILTLQSLMGALINQKPENITTHEQAVQLFQAIGDQWGEALARYWLADSLRLYRQHDLALQHFAQSQQLFQQIGDDWGVALTLQGMGSAAYRQGEHDLARSHLTQALQFRRRSGDKWLIAQTLTTLATVLQTEGDTATAVFQFQKADKLYKDIGDDYGRLYALFKLGQLAQQSDDVANARTYYQDCLTLAEAFEHSGRIADCQAALAQLDGGRTAVVTSHPSLYITAFGSGEVRRADSSLIGSSDWGYARVKELFFYLLDGKPQTKAQIGLDFWPDASPARLRRNLHDTLYQLRKALGNSKWIVYENGRYTFDHTLAYQYDVADFHRHLQTPTIDNLQQAVTLYRADFLTEFDGEWCLLRRENLRQAFLTALLQLGDLLMADGRYPQAAAIYRQTINHDNLLEAAHRQLMQALIQMGESAQAARQYQLLIQLLEDELGVAPAPETAVLWQQLQQK